MLARGVKHLRRFIHRLARSDDVFCFGLGGQNGAGGALRVGARTARAGTWTGGAGMMVVSLGGRR